MEVFTKMFSDYNGKKPAVEIFDILLDKINALRKYLNEVKGSRRIVNSSLFITFDRAAFTRINADNS